jgi:hypothetical protein
MTLTVPMLLYGRDNFIYLIQHARTERAQVNFLRWVAERTLFVHKTNEAIRKELNTHKLNAIIIDYCHKQA